ncbi:MAG: hypothetical protein OXD54_03335 [Candidatus Poribacteria bacterium]|nr:hypothetical protein [Candidatus Poribacteria bacterium]
MGQYKQVVQMLASPFTTSTVGHTESHTCGVQVRPHTEAREMEAGKAVWKQLLFLI